MSMPSSPSRLSGMRDAFRAAREVFRSEVEANPAISLHELYYQLATHTTASHAGLYNDACYGNVYRNTLEEFLKPL